MSAAEVSTILWRERELLDLLLFKLSEEQALLATGQTRWLARATNEVELVLEEIRRTEVRRAVESTALAGELGLPVDAGLRALTAALDEPWRHIFTEHRKAFLQTTHEVQAMAEANRDLLSTGYRSLCEALLEVGDVTDVYTASGRPASGSAGRSRILDGAL